MSAGSGPRYLEDHQLRGDALVLDIAAEAAEAVAAAADTAVGHTAKTLVKDGPLRIIIVGMRRGSTLRDHDAEGPVSIHVLQGQVQLAALGESRALNAGQAIAYAASVTHSVEALDDSALLLTIAFAKATPAA